VELGVGPVQSTDALPHTQDEQSVCPGPPLWPMYAGLRVFIFSLIPFWGSGSRSQSPPCMAGSFGCVLGPLYGLP
jgi:hypothetical protein